MDNQNYKYKNLKYCNLSLLEKNGKPMYKSISSFVVFDLETTGFYPEQNEIINIGAIRYRRNKPVAELNILVKPKQRIPAIITSITGITNQMVADKPSIKEALPILLDFIGDDIILGHNVRFDLGFLNYALASNGFDTSITRYMDTLTIARSFRKYNKLENLIHDYLNPFLYQEHLALSDAKYTAEIFKVFKKMDIKAKQTY